MMYSIEFQSLDRIVGQEGRSKLIAKESSLYTTLHQLKEEIKSKYKVKSDRMDLHIEITKQRQDSEFREKAESIHQSVVDLSDKSNWGFLGRAFVLWTPEVESYGKTHITLAFFGSFPRPDLEVLQEIAINIAS